MHYKNKEGLEDLKAIRAALSMAPKRLEALAALGRIENDLDVLAEALDIHGLHRTGRGCLGKKHPDACNCGLDHRRERAGLARTTSKDAGVRS